MDRSWTFNELSFTPLHLRGDVFSEINAIDGRFVCCKLKGSGWAEGKSVRSCADGSSWQIQLPNKRPLSGTRVEANYSPLWQKSHLFTAAFNLLHSCCAGNCKCPSPIYCLLTLDQVGQSSLQILFGRKTLRASHWTLMVKRFGLSSHVGDSTSFSFQLRSSSVFVYGLEKKYKTFMSLLTKEVTKES